VDFAVWCGYKYLNGGPGAIGGAFVHERHARAFDLPRLAGWWGHDPASRFAMPHAFAPQAGAAGWQVSNPPILSMTPLLASLDLFARAGMDALRAKSLRLVAFLREAIAAQVPGVRVLTPSDSNSHGSQVSLAFNLNDTHLARLRHHLHAAGVVGDWREPDVLRVAPVPLYNTFADVAKFVSTLKTALTHAVA
jgi:kynureninase